MKKILKIISGLVIVIAIALALVFYFTADMVTTADKFFSAIKENNLDEAYSHTSEDFKKSTSKNELEDFLFGNSFNDFKEASWGSRSVSGGRGTLTGSITTNSGGVIPVTVGLVKSQSGWKIYFIKKPLSGIQEETSTAQLPDEQTQVDLVNESMLIFAESVKEKSMSKFHQHISSLWQKDYTVQKLDEAFGVFYDLDADLTILKNYTPAFDARSIIDENGVMVIAGQYPTKPSKMYFKQSYIYEGLGWKLIGFSANIK